MVWEKIAAVLEEKNITIYELANRLNIQTNKLYSLKWGKTKQPRFQLVCQIADALNVPTDRFRIEEESIKERLNTCGKKSKGF